MKNDSYSLRSTALGNDFVGTKLAKPGIANS
ncbi:hypothetical protein A2U01_0089077, partial [Trifolium medium]|nr:hypothetical protein [Trifolium medium]